MLDPTKLDPNAIIAECVRQECNGLDVSDPCQRLRFEIDLDRRVCLQSFYFFAQRAYPIAYNTPMVDGWNVAARCYHLQALWEEKLWTAEGKLASTLIINEPSGLGKSQFACVLYPAWIWAVEPSAGLWFSSFSQGLCDRDANDMRRLITSDWYQQRFWRDIQLSEDQNARTRFDNSRGGWRLSRSIESKVGYGEHPRVLLCVPFEGLVETEDGMLRIGDIVNERRDVSVLSFDHDAGLPEFQPILDWEENPGRELIEIEMEDGTVLTVTEDHPVFVQGRGYIEACHIQPGQSVVTMGAA